VSSKYKEKITEHKLYIPVIHITSYSKGGKMAKRNIITFEVSKEKMNEVEALPRTFNLSDRLREKLDEILDEQKVK